MADTTGMIDYYAVLNLPTGAGLGGIHNAYARLSGELAVLGEVDEASSEALRKLNEAYSVLSRAESRRTYDDVFLAKQRAQVALLERKRLRRRTAMQNVLIGALLLIVLTQAGVLAYLGWDHVTGAFDVVRGWATPGGAG